MSVKLVRHTIYRGEYDPAPGRGKRPEMVALQFVSAPVLTKPELLSLIAELQVIADQMA